MKRCASGLDPAGRIGKNIGVRPLFESWLEERLGDLRRSHLHREPLLVDGHGPNVTVGDRSLINFAGNDYLGLGALATAQGAPSASASRLVTGHGPAHQALEKALAAFLECPAALSFSSGYAANVGTLAALVGPDDVIFSDRLNHASLIDGCRLSRARIVIFDHASPQSLKHQLQEYRSAGEQAWVVTESLFSMDGDAAPLAEISRLAAEFKAQLFVDEAHAIGVCGPGGRGLCAQLNVRPDVLIGTLGKSLGAQGAFVAGSDLLIDFLWNRARSFVFSTGLSPVLARTALRNLELLHDDRRRDHLHRLSSVLSTGVANGPWEHRTGPGAIHSLVLGDPETALAKAHELHERGLLVRAIRPPTVPTGTSRLRIVLSAFHTDAHVAQLLEALR